MSRLRRRFWRQPIMIRRVTGRSMEPYVQPGKLVVARRFMVRPARYDVVVVRHNGLEKIKRIADIVDDQIFLLGDNLDHSTDSRHFGWVSMSDVIGKVVWPAKLTSIKMVSK